MQNKNNKIIITLLIIVILILGYLVFFKNKKADNDETHFQQQITTATIDELDARNTDISCGNALPDEGKTFTISGYIYYSDLAYFLTGNRDESNVDGFNLLNKPIVFADAKRLSVKITSNRNAIIETLHQHYNPSSTSWTHVVVTGKVHSFDMNMMGTCKVGISLEIDTLGVEN